MASQPYYICHAMPPEVIVLSIGLFFVEDAINYVVKNFAFLGKLLPQYANNQPSIVRKIGTHLTWIHAQRIHIIWSDGFNDNVSPRNVIGDLQPNDNSGQSLTYSMELEAKVKEMEKELLNIQSQVSKLLQAQDGRLSFNGNEDVENTVSSTTNLIPPPPPPMPPIPLVNPCSEIVKFNTNIRSPEEMSVNSIIEELSKKRPKLRHVQLTPGGRPKRLSPRSDDPSDVLLAVLKRRFDAMHSP